MAGFWTTTKFKIIRNPFLGFHKILTFRISFQFFLSNVTDQAETLGNFKRSKNIYHTKRELCSC